jgi:hypothetical protein
MSRTMMRISSSLIAILLAWSMAGVATAAASPSNEPAPFVREWRAVLTGGEAKLLPYAGSSFRIERRHIGAAELDALEALLLPALAAELKRVGSRDPPCGFFRQYAAAVSGKYHLILVHGFLRDTGHGIDWTRKPVGATDARASFWDAVYIVERHRLAKMRRKGDTVRHPVIFQGVA